MINNVKNFPISFDEEDQFFKSDAHKLIFILLQTYGKNRNDLLGIGDDHYENHFRAKKWYTPKVQLLVNARFESQDDRFRSLIEQAVEMLNLIYQDLFFDDPDLELTTFRTF